MNLASDAQWSLKSPSAPKTMSDESIPANNGQGETLTGQSNSTNELQRHVTLVGTASTPHHALPESITWRVRRSWELLSEDLEVIGIDFFYRLLEENPDILQLFSFGGADLSDGKLPRALQNHAFIVMEMLGQCVTGLTQLEEMVPKLRAVGHVHAGVGVLPHHYDLLFKYLVETIATKLDPQDWDIETRQAWELSFRSITRIMQRPRDLLQLEPLEGWGLINALACAYISIITPFRMAGFTSRTHAIELSFNILTTLSCICLALDLFSQRISEKIRVRKVFRKQSKKGVLSRQVSRLIFPVKFRALRTLRSLRMERWPCWPRTDALVLLSFPLQYSSRLFLGTPTESHAGVHWTFLFGLLRLAAGARVLHFVGCAEHNLMLRRRTNEHDRSALRIAKLVLFTLGVIHVSACLWCIVARVELGPHAVEPKASPFFPHVEILLGGNGIFHGYLHAVHWAWVNLAGIGNVESDPDTTLECIVTLLVHIFGATLYTITTGNVVTILETMTQESQQTGAELAELGEFMHTCNVPEEDQKRILQGYMMHHLVGGPGGSEDNDDEGNAGIIDTPEAVSRLPSYLRHEVSSYALAEAIKRRDPAFSHTSNEFLFAIVGSLQGRTMLLSGDYYFKEDDNHIPEQFLLVEKGTLEVISLGRTIRLLSRGDTIGKRWLLRAGGGGGSSGNGGLSTPNSHTSLRALTACTLLTGLSLPSEVADLHQRYEKDFALLRADRERINKGRSDRQQRRNHQQLRGAVYTVELANKLRNPVLAEAG